MSIMQRGGPDLTFVGFMLLAAFGSLVWNTSPLESPRPQDKQQIDTTANQDHIDSWLWQDPFTKHNKLPSNACDFSSSNHAGRIIAPMVTTSMDEDSVERRIRRRYAVVAALSESEYQPSNARKIEHCYIGKKTTHQTKEGEKTELNIETVVRWESYTRNTSPKSINILWLDNNYFTEDLNTHLGKLFKPNTKTKSDVYLLGPADSDSLKHIHAKMDKANLPNGVSNLTIYSPVATADGKFNFDEGTNIKLLRTIHQDSALAEKLYHELTARKIGDLSEVAIITERDTHYGRQLPLSLCTAFNCDAEKLQQFYYLRGIDAYQASSEKNKGETKQTAPPQGNRLSISNHTHPPTGQSQYDYLRRLATQIEQLRDSRENKKEKLKAIGIFGSDIYDKLLILQALRSRFPGVLFFTTDLDAQMMHPQHWRWTRNLIVASNFDLHLNNDYQKSFPPFRDAYQTSFYLSTLVAADHRIMEKICSDATKCSDFFGGIKPIIFEIGRNGPVRLTDISPLDTASQKNGVAITDIHPTHDSQNGYDTSLLPLIILTLLLIFIIHQIRPNSGALIVMLIFSAAILFAFTHIITEIYNEEPFSLTDGVSVWPTIYLRLIAFALAVAFIFKSICDMEVNFARLSRDYFGDKHPPNEGTPKYKTLRGPVEPTPFPEILQGFSPSKLLQVFKKTTPDFWMKCITALAVVVIGAIVLWLSRSPEYGLLFALGGWLLLIFICILISTKMSNDTSINHWVENTPAPKSLDDLWKGYHEHGRLEKRLLRATSMWTLFMAVNAILLHLSPTWPAPARGSVFLLDEAIFVLGTLFMMILIFLALDAQRLCIYWMKKLRKELLQRANFAHECKDGKLATRCEPQKLKEIVALVADRTNEVDKLIYYPLIIIILMLLARNNFFDNWGFPQAIGILVCINISMLIGAGLKLRNEARKVKTTALECLDELPTNMQSPKQNENDIITMREQIMAVQGGAFQPMYDQPVIRALLLIMGSIGLTISEYVSLFGR